MDLVKVNYRSDFDFILELTDCEGKAIGWPQWDWSARFWTSSCLNPFVASCRGGVCVNCFNDEGRIHVVCDNHRLGPGGLNVDFTAYIRDDRYPDGDRRRVVPKALGIELTGKAGVCPADLSAQLTLPVLVKMVDEIEAPVFGAVLDRINEKLEEILGEGGGGAAAVRQVAGAGPRVIQRGMISTGAMPGVVYRNLGYIRVPLGELVPGAEVEASVSGVDLDCVEGVVCFPLKGYAEAELDREQEVVRVRVVEDMPEWRYNLSVRLRLRDRDKEGVMRCEDGLIRPVGLGFEPVERAVEAPRVPQGLVDNCRTIVEAIGKLFPGRMVDMEYKYCSGTNRGSVHWKRVRYGSKGNRRTCGVARVRFSKGRRRRASGWTVFTFCRIGDSMTFSVRPL